MDVIEVSWLDMVMSGFFFFHVLAFSASSFSFLSYLFETVLLVSHMQRQTSNPNHCQINYSKLCSLAWLSPLRQGLKAQPSIWGK